MELVLMPDEDKNGDDTEASPAVVTCPACAEPVSPGANWCEACGHDLVNNTAIPARCATLLPDHVPTSEQTSVSGDDEQTEPSAPCQACGETGIDAEGYCLSCGYRQPAERNHISEVTGPVAAATDRGRVRHRNEDAFAIAVSEGGQAVLVVCDGVSSTPGSEEASTAAATIACQTVVDGLNQADAADGDSAGIDKLLITAVSEAQAAATAVAETMQSQNGQQASALIDPPSTTLVCAVVSIDDGKPDPAFDLHIAWVGDSRCYWVTPTAVKELTTDHEVSGALSRWLGADSIQPEPDIAHHRFALNSAAETGWVLVCSDGLWRYLTPSTGMRADELIAAISHNLASNAVPDESGDDLDSVGDTAGKMVDGLIEFANNRGGHDNITAAITSPVISFHQGQESQ